MSFQVFGLDEMIVHGVQSMRYVEPTPIQEKAIPVVMEGRDLIASAQTGTGKTAAFSLPLLSRLKGHSGLRGLVLQPTRELAAQVAENMKDYTRFTDLRISLIHGGVKYGGQERSLAQNPDVVVATPGRLLDHMERGNLSLKQVKILVLDEADRMLDMGFMPDVRRIIEGCAKERQTMLFSATIPPEIEHLASWALKDPETISIGVRRSPAETVAHALYPVASTQKFELLKSLLEDTHYESVLVFSKTRAGADQISGWLENHGHTVGVLHSDRTQAQRTQALEGFKSGKYEVMVATDIAARGIDISGVSHVINYDVPEHAEDYVHRIGRTGRAQTTGDAFTLMCGQDVEAVEAIEGFIGKKIERKKLAGFSYVYTALLDENAGSGAGAGRSSARRSRGGGRRRRR